MRCWFDFEALALFEPKDRFITGLALVHRWSGIGDHVRDFIRARIAESRLTDIHPVFGGTQWTEGDDFPSEDTALFALAQIEAVEVQDGIDPRLPAQVAPAQDELGHLLDDAHESDESLESAPSGVSRTIIMGAFQARKRDIDNKRLWDTRLSDPPKWLLVARISSGRRGLSALWDPKLVAHALLAKGEMSAKALDKTMQERFKSQWDAWIEETKDIPR